MTRSPARRAAAGALAAGLAVSLLSLAPSASADPAGAAPAAQAPLPVASPDDAAPIGWATLDGGTDGGAGAPADSTYVVTNRAELFAALDNGGRPTEPKVVYVSGTIHGNETADGRLLGQEDYAPGFDLDLYLTCFGENGWSDQLHDYCRGQRQARVNGSNAIKRQIEIKIPSNTTVLGLGDDAGFDQTNLMLHLGENIVIRNLTVEAPVDWFTSWDPWDGDNGAWNARFDALSSVTARKIWVDHVTFTDGAYPDSQAPTGPNGEPVQRHDGLFDMKDGTDLVTVTNSRFSDHDKTMLLGSGDDNADTDEGRLRITLAGNYFDGTAQRSPRVRFGQVHVLNNYYAAKVNDPVSPIRSAANGGSAYFLGLGHESRIYSEGNAFEYTGPGADTAILVRDFGATAFTDTGSWFKGSPVDAAALVPHMGDAGWDPAEVYRYQPLTDHAAVKWHGKHRTGAGVLEVPAPTS